MEKSASENPHERENPTYNLTEVKNWYRISKSILMNNFLQEKGITFSSLKQNSEEDYEEEEEEKEEEKEDKIVDLGLEEEKEGKTEEVEDEEDLLEQLARSRVEEVVVLDENEKPVEEDC